MAVIAEKNSDVLGEFAWEIIDHPKSLFFLDKDGSGDIDWLGSERDMVVFAQILKILEQTQDLDDEQFLEQCLEEIESLLNYSSLFNGLDSPSIAVTEAHNGTTPKEHSTNVLKKLRTYGISPDVRIMLRFSALFHDVGKASCAGLSEEEIQTILLYKEPPQDQSSYPDHDKISFLVVQKIRNELSEEVPLLKNVLSEDLWSSLEFVVLHHHIVPDIFSHKIITLPDFVVLINNLEKTQLLAVLLGLYLLNMADVDSNDHYRQWLVSDSFYFGEILEAISLDSLSTIEDLNTLIFVYFQGLKYSVENCS